MLERIFESVYQTKTKSVNLVDKAIKKIFQFRIAAQTKPIILEIREILK